MKKLISLVCVVALLCSVTVSALANGSINGTQAQNVGTLMDHVKFQSDVTVNNRWNQIVKDLYAEFSNPDSQYSLKALIERLMELDVNKADKELKGDVLVIKNQDGEDVSIDLSKADFSSAFSQVCLDYDGSVFYSFNGNEVAVTLTLVYEQLKGRQANEFSFLLIDPETGYFTFVELDPANFNAETGEITIEFPFMGIFALIEK